MTVDLRPARPTEAAALTGLAMRSKAHWGYSDEFLEACRPELTVQPEWCDGRHLVVAVEGDRLLGYFRLSGRAPEGTLEALFVDEPSIGRGIGALLFDEAVAHADALGWQSLLIEADPGAEGFYRHRGAVLIGRTPSGSIPGRVLPLLRHHLSRRPT